MKQKKTDLRVIKTIASIKSVFLDLLKKKSVDKITITEIAEKALINKGTFYLHYQDIYVLYEEVIHDKIIEFCDAIDFYEDFFYKPRVFVKNFIECLSKEEIEKTFPYLSPLSTKVPIPDLMADELKVRLYAQKILPQSVSNDIRLDYVLFGLFTIAFRYGKTNFEETVDSISQIIELLFVDIKGNK